MFAKVVRWCLVFGVLVASRASLTLGQTLSIDGEYCSLSNTEIRCTGIDSHNFTKVAFDFKIITATVINIQDSYLHLAPDGMFDIYTKIVKLRISGVQLQQLPANAFKSGNYLETLDLSENQIGQIPEGIFKDTPNLKDIILFKNKLTKLGPNVFSGLSAPNIRLDLSNNLLKTIDPNAFKSVQVDYIDLSYNKLLGVNALHFFKYVDASEVNLSFNCLSKIPTETFGTKRNLKNLDLTGTCLAYPNELYGAFPNTLRVLNMAANPLVGLRPELFETTPNLKQLGIGWPPLKPADIVQILETLQLDQIDFSAMKFNCTDLAHISTAARKANTTYVVSQPNYNANNINGYPCT